MTYKGNKPIKSPSAIGDHLLKNHECSKHYIKNKLTLLDKERKIYQ